MDFRNFSLMINQSKVGDFTNHLADRKIMGTTCRKCGGEFYPPRADCPSCLSEEMEWFECPNEGKLCAYTQIVVLPEHFALPKISIPFGKAFLTPSPVGLLEVKPGIRIMGWVPSASPEDLSVGERMRASPHVLEDGRMTIILEKLKGS